MRVRAPFCPVRPASVEPGWGHSKRCTDTKNSQTLWCRIALTVDDRSAREMAAHAKTKIGVTPEAATGVVALDKRDPEGPSRKVLRVES